MARVSAGKSGEQMVAWSAQWQGDTKASLWDERTAAQLACDLAKLMVKLMVGMMAESWVDLMDGLRDV